ncbi:MAG TPA: hypothetical protein VND22_08595 [Actinomycetota bacterium]|nr:hypothetical protein [Actinomycetota bacterium]
MSRKVRFAIALLAVVFVAVSCKDGAPIIGKKKQDSTKAHIQIVQVLAADTNDRPEAADKANQESQKIKQALDRYYQAAFLDPGKQLDLNPHFTAEAQPGLPPNVGALALGDIAPKLERVVPKKQEATKVSFLIEEDLSAPVAIATVLFEATGEAKEKADGPVAITHNATFWFQPEGDGYKISAYTVELKADTETKKAAFGVPAGELSGGRL